MTDVYRDSRALTGVLLECLETDNDRHPAMRDHLARLALDLLDQIVFLELHPTLQAADVVDDRLELLRVHLELAYDLTVLGEHDFFDLAGQADLVGRQLGQWRERMGR